MPGWKNVKSSVIKALAYNERDKKLKVRFVENGETVNYVYFKVPVKTFLEFRNAASYGKYFMENIRNKFIFQKLENFLLSDANKKEETEKLEKKLTELENSVEKQESAH